MVQAAVADAHRREWGFVLAATVRVTRDLDLAEECVQDAYARALTTWPVDGIPARPAAWLTTVARRRAIDELRREAARARALPLLVVDEAAEDSEGAEYSVPDDRLRLIFTCCHPALALEAQVALTLRLVCGLTTAEAARAFLVKEPTMAARITRAKKKIAAARIPYAVPGPEDLPERVQAVTDVVHLMFTTGHTAPSGADLLRADLIERSLDLARVLHAMLPDDAEVTGLLALLLLTDARTPARVDSAGRLLLLADQDRSLWNRSAIEDGTRLAQAALAHRPAGRFALLAGIAAVHDASPRWEATDWGQIICLYDLLLQVWPSPVVALNRAVAVGLAQGPALGLAELDQIADEPQLASYGYLAAARADFFRRLGRRDEARTSYEEALLLTENEAERTFLTERLTELTAAKVRDLPR